MNKSVVLLVVGWVKTVGTGPLLGVWWRHQSSLVASGEPNTPRASLAKQTYNYVYEPYIYITTAVDNYVLAAHF